MSLYPRLVWLEEGPALQLRLTAGPAQPARLALTLGSFGLVFSPCAGSLLSLYLSPISPATAAARLVALLSWLAGPSLAAVFSQPRNPVELQVDNHCHCLEL